MSNASGFTKHAHCPGNACRNVTKIQCHIFHVSFKFLVTAGVNVINPAYEVSVFSWRDIAAYQELEVGVFSLFNFALLCGDALLLSVVFVEVTVVAVPVILSQAYFLLPV